jgi:hypothetical protein
MTMSRHRLVVLWFLAVMLGICAEPRPSWGGDWSDGYKADLKKTAELRRAKANRIRAAGMKQRAEIQEAMRQQAAMEQMAMQQMQLAFLQAQANQARMWYWANGRVGGGGGGGESFAPEIDAGPAAGAVGLLVAGVLMVADRRRARLA